MEQGLKERLVGAAVLVVLAVIFVPMVLDGPDAPPSPAPATVAAVATRGDTFDFDLNAPMPATAPATSASPTASNTASTTASTTATVATATAPATVAPAAPAPEVKAAATPSAPVKATPAAGAWAAQVGAFSSQSKADEVSADLKAKGFKAFVMAHKDGKTTLYRVRVGPVTSRADAEALARKITSKTGQAARPVPHP